MNRSQMDLGILSVPNSMHAIEAFEHFCIPSTTCFNKNSPFTSDCFKKNLFNTASNTAHTTERTVNIRRLTWLGRWQRTNLGLLNAHVQTYTKLLTHFFRIMFCSLIKEHKMGERNTSVGERKPEEDTWQVSVQFFYQLFQELINVKGVMSA